MLFWSYTFPPNPPPKFMKKIPFHKPKKIPSRIENETIHFAKFNRQKLFPPTKYLNILNHIQHAKM